MKHFLLILFLVSGYLPDNDIIVTQRENNYLRTGPGAFYPLVVIIPGNIKLKLLEKENKWVKVQLPDKKTGWIAENCISSTAGESQLEKNLIRSKTTSDVSRTALTAAIKGLSGKGFRAEYTANLDKLNELSERRIDPSKFKFFSIEIDNTISANRGAASLKSLQLDNAGYDPNADELKTGLAAAARLSEKIDSGSKKDEYINLITNKLIAGSGIYDWEFRTFLLSDSKVNGYACPGGFIFITEGAYDLCKDESELAFIIAHEIAHVISRHGLQELSKRRVHINAENSFGELEKESGEEIGQTEAGMNELIELTYEHIVHKRLLKYEMQADKAAAILLANAGYDPFSSIRIAKKLSELYFSNKDIFDYNYSEPDAAKLRHDEIKNYVQRMFRQDNPGARMEKRFRSY